MDSSTSTSRSPTRSLASLLVSGVAFILAAVGASLYIKKVDPEVHFWTAVLKTRLNEVSDFPEQPTRFLCIGGSSCAFSVDSHVLANDYGLQVVNLGVHAGAGRAFQLETALPLLRPGDVLVVAYETPLWRQTEPIKAEPLGSKLWYSFARPTDGGPSLLTDLGIHNPYSTTHLRPGGYHCITLLTKLLLRRDLYRYRLSDISKSRRLTTDYQESPVQPVSELDSGGLSKYNRTFLRKLSGYVTERGATLAVSLPWQLAQEAILEDQRALNQKLATEISAICICLNDPAYGVQSTTSYYSDTVWHLSDEGSERRNRVLGESLQAIQTLRVR